MAGQARSGSLRWEGVGMTITESQEWGLGLEAREWDIRSESLKQHSSCNVENRMERQNWGQRDQCRVPLLFFDEQYGDLDGDGKWG